MYGNIYTTLTYKKIHISKKIYSEKLVKNWKKIENILTMYNKYNNYIRYTLIMSVTNYNEYGFVI